MLVTAEEATKQIAIVQNALRLFTLLQLTTFQYPGQTFISETTYDYVIVGGGTAGCVIANRLAEGNKTSVLLIEAGDIPTHETDIPNLMLYLKQSEASWNYSVEETGLSRQYQRPLEDDMSLGKVLGGTSSVNYLLYSVGNRYDFNSWADIVNDDIWNWENVQPYFRKSQRLLDRQLASTENGQLYGRQGNIGLTLSRYKIRNLLFRALEETGNARVDSFNGNVSVGCADAMFTLANGVRQNTALTYLTPKMYNRNLRVLIKTVVKKIIFDSNKNAIGVVVKTNHGKDLFIKARKEVILSAGVVNSPKLLMLSGVGPKQHLKKHDIKTISDLPVGQNLQDHMSAVVVYNITKLVTPLKPWNPHKYPAPVVVSFTPLNKCDEIPDYQAVNFINYPIFLMMYCVFSYGYIDEVCNNMLKTDTNTVMLYSVINKLRFKSKGKIFLRSGSYEDDPIIYLDYYTNEEDIEDHARAIEDFVKIGNTEEFKKMGAVFKDPGLDSCKRFNLFSRSYWKCYVNAMATSLHNYSSTCSMGSVVDSHLRVYGVKRLRVADASVMPHPTAGGTLGATVMIGEKVSDIIKKDNGNLRRRRRFPNK